MGRPTAAERQIASGAIPRETFGSPPTVGYHCPVVDYVVNGATVNNCTLNIDQGRCWPSLRSGPLGNFYLPSTATTALLGHGSRPAWAAGLFHYIPLAIDTKEQNNTVNIGPADDRVRSKALPAGLRVRRPAL
jgi:hypothetical protein